MGRHEERSPEPGTSADDQGRVSGRGSEGEHRGDFAEGQSETHTPPDARRGDFARGMGDEGSRGSG